MNVPCRYCQYNPRLVITGSWLLELPLAAVSQNQLKANVRGRGGWQYRKVKKSFMEAILERSVGIPRADAKRRVFFSRLYTGRCRHFDRDNLCAGMKPIRDCLTELGLIVDDSDRWLEAHYTQLKVDAPEQSVVILLEDIQWQPGPTTKPQTT